RVSLPPNAVPVSSHRGSAGRRRQRRPCRRRLLLLLDRPQPRDVLIVLLEIFRKRVPAGSVGNEKDLLGACGIGGRFERRTPWIGDRPRRQAIDSVGIVRCGLLDVAPRDRSTKGALAADKAVDDRRIRLQTDSLLQTIDEHSGNAGTLLR